MNGDALDITAQFNITEQARERDKNGGLLGLLLRCVDIGGVGTDDGKACVVVSYNITTQSICAGWAVSEGGHFNASFDFNALENKRCVAANIVPMRKEAAQKYHNDGDGQTAVATVAATYSVLELRVFLDRSIIEVYANGAALTQRCLLPTGVDLHAPNNASADVFFYVSGEPELNNGTDDGEYSFVPRYEARNGSTQGESGVYLKSLEAWHMGTMWGQVN